MSLLLPLLLALLAAALLVRHLVLSRPGLPPAALQEALRAGTAVLIDIREPAECAATGAARHSVHLPLSDMLGGRARWAAFLEKHRNRRLLLYCASGARSSFAARKLRAEGFDAVNAGSLAALDRAGIPVCRRRA
jgi:rhodanese-related sulfurtransferase